MLTGLLIIATVAFLGVFSHRRSRLENKILKNIPLSEWLTVLVFPLIFYLGWFFVVENILERPRVEIFPLRDFDFLAITILFMVYGFVGNAIHFTSKILWRYLKEKPYSLAYKINEMFHNKLSHYLVYLNSIGIIFFLAFLEINHPVGSGVTSVYLYFVFLLGMILGVSASKAVFYTNEWFGGYNKPLFFLVSTLLFILFFLFKTLKLRYSFYPVNFFVVSMSLSFLSFFIFRQIFIFAKLDQKKRLRILAKLLNI